MLITGNKYAKIAPYFKTDLEDYSSKDRVEPDNLQLAIQIQDAPMAKDFMNVRDQLTPDQRAGVTNQFHENIKSKGFECKECHNDKKSILNFKKLGFSEQRISDLTTLEIVGIITRYQEFYLPEFFKDNAPNSQ